MDWSSLSGIALALIGILFGQALEGGHIGSLLQPAAFVIVFFGTFGAVLLQTKLSNFISGIAMLKQVFQTPTDDRIEISHQASSWSHIARKEGVFMLESLIENESDPFIQKGLRLMADGTPPERLREVCAIDMYYFEAKQRSAVKIWESAGGYSPTIGIIGAVLGLIHVMENLSDPAMLGSGIAVAFVATIYGVGLANLFFLPVSNKLKSQIQHEIMRREMLLNAWVSIARGDHPRIVEERLLAYLI